MDPFGAQMNRQHLAAIIAHLQGLAGAPMIPGIGQETFGVPTQPSYALPGGPQAQYTLPSSLPSGDPWSPPPGAVRPDGSVMGLGGAIGIKAEDIRDGYFHDAIGDHDVRSQ